MLKRLPPFNQIISVYAVIAFMLFAWTALLFFWNLPAWLNFMTLDVALAVFSYSIGASLIESLALLLSRAESKIFATNLLKYDVTNWF